MSSSACPKFTIQTARECAERFVAFLNKSPSPFHAVHECKQRLAGAGFAELREDKPWELQPNGKYYVTTNGSSIFAFAIGGKFKPGNGFSLIAAHTDSPCLKLKPNSHGSSSGYLTVHCQLYGGGVWRTWFDRDLTVAGRVFIKNGTKLTERLVHINRPIMSVPNLAIHLSRDSNEAFKMNTEEHIVPVLATSIADSMNRPATQEPACGQASAGNNSAPDATQQSYPAGTIHSALVDALARELGVGPETVYNCELVLVDCQPAAIGGIHKEFIYGGRLDNLLSTFTVVEGLVESVSHGLADDTNVRFVACYDHEEIGSESAQGARTNKTMQFLRRITQCPALALGSSLDWTHVMPSALEVALPKSLLVSADQAHAVHPNYASKHESNHKVQMHGGAVIKVNANQRYATNAHSHSVIMRAAEMADVPLQAFVVRNDSACGSTVGPAMAAGLGMQTVDMGFPQLAMHSIREMAGVSSVEYGIRLFSKFLEAYPKIYSEMENI